MQVSCDQSVILPEDWAQLLADGGSNAIGSIQEYEVMVDRQVLSLISATLTRMSAQGDLHLGQ
jgi:hypothetical protein